MLDCTIWHVTITVLQYKENQYLIMIDACKTSFIRQQVIYISQRPDLYGPDVSEKCIPLSLMQL